MLKIKVKTSEGWDEAKCEFIPSIEQTLLLEHSLISLSKWETKWHKSFLDKNTQRTREEDLDYIRCMTLNTKEVDPNVYNLLTNDQLTEITNYINDPMTATKINEKQNKGGHSGNYITNEVIYYWMISLNIPFECEKWHLNRLLTLIRVCEIKNNPGKKMSNGEIMRHNADLNRARRKRLNTKG